MDAIRRSLVVDIFSLVQASIQASRSKSPAKTENEGEGMDSASDSAVLSSPTFKKRLRKWIWLLGWSVQSQSADTDSNGAAMDISEPTTIQEKRGPIISMSKAWQCIEECFECLPLSDSATWFEWLISEEWMQSGSEVKVPASELGVPLRFFRTLLLRVSYATSAARTSVAQPHRLAHLAGLILSYASSILPLCHASGLNRKSLINSSRKTPIVIPDASPLLSKSTQDTVEVKSQSGDRSDGRRGSRTAATSARPLSVFDSAQPLLKACQVASNPNGKAPQPSHGSQHAQARARETPRPASLTKANYDLLWDFVSRVSSLGGKLNDPKESLRVDANLVSFDQQLQKVLPILVSYEANDKAATSEIKASETPSVALETSRSNLASLSNSSFAPNSIASFLSPNSLQSSTYLTLPFATHLQLLQPAFRLQLVVHILIFLHSLKKPSVAPVAGAKPLNEKALSADGLATLETIIQRVQSALSAVLQKTLTTPKSDHSSSSSPVSSNTAFLMCQSVLSFMESEAKYVDWKVANCPDFELPLPTSVSSNAGETSSLMETDGEDAQPRANPKKRSAPFWFAPVPGEPSAPGVVHSSAITSTNMAPLHQSLQEFVTANKRRKEAPLRDGFIGCDASSKRPKFNLGAPALNNLFNSAPTERSGLPSLDDALGEIPTSSSTWRSRRVIRYGDNLSAYTALCLSAQNSEGEPFDLASFVSASNRAFPSPLFVPPAPPTPPPEPEPVVEPEPVPAEASGAGEETNSAMEVSEPTSAAPTSPDGSGVDEAAKESVEEQPDVPVPEEDEGLGELFVEE